MQCRNVLKGSCMKFNAKYLTRVPHSELLIITPLAHLLNCTLIHKMSEEIIRPEEIACLDIMVIPENKINTIFSQLDDYRTN